MNKNLNKRNFKLLAILIIFVGFFIFEYFNHQVPGNLAQPGLEELIIETGSNNDIRPAIDNPEFESVPLADTYLLNEGQGIVLIKNNSARFYPFQILVWHNLVNDIWNGFPVLVVYDPLCGSVAVFERDTDDAVVLNFKNSGKIYNNMSLFTDDGTGSLWSPFDGKIIVGSDNSGDIEGERPPSPGYGGVNLSPLQSYVMTWQSFKTNFPDGYVLSRETGSARDYSNNPYGNYSETPAVWYPLTKYDSTYPAKTVVYGYGSDVFPLDNIKSSGTINGIEVDFVWDEELETVRGYDKNQNEMALSSAYWFCWVGNQYLSPNPSL